MKVYFDNAATTPLDREVFEAMEPYLFGNFGNPSSAHAHGREARIAIERSRATIAGLLGTASANIIFTSGGTEGDNTAILSGIRRHRIRLAITTPFEHHAVLNTLRSLEQKGEIRLVLLQHDDAGNLSLTHLETLLAGNERAFVSVMHGNNETGNLHNLEAIGALCRQYDAVFHSDTVQTMGHCWLDPQKLHLDYLVGSAHKFHGPKGVGFLYNSGKADVLPLLLGGSQEKAQRGGTENVSGIVGLARALEIAYRDIEADRQHIQSLKNRMTARLTSRIADVQFNGNALLEDKSLYTILSVSLPKTSVPVLTHLDQHFISASGGSACTSHSASRSHVLQALNFDFERTAVRFSFSKHNTTAEVDHVADTLAEAFNWKYAKAG
ncbi:cysteine desulfurase family protein [Hufsiella ginkgonis]|uniref:cysteine desulfurase n=1 Tax=Hufsiella ginkgonis TaxID=2695274 RepID=A0A7K1XZR5_9SPHI|nr:cysteine desulfurase family protein [Hufsiella ginkgonis]MXV16515.1 aminotransferase class V-fold PLP-dependent enzyme [Hufsiella ginkgonis]